MRKILLTLLFPLILLFSCNDNDEDKVKELTTDRTEISLLPNENASINIVSGNGDYVVRSSNDKIVKASISGNVININSLNVEQNAHVTIYVLDAKGKTINIDITISRKFELLLDQTEITLYAGVENQNSKTIRIKSGNSLYKAIILENPDNSISLDTVGLAVYGKFIINANAAGISKIKLTDAKAKEVTVDVTVLSPDHIDIDKTDITIIAIQGEDKLNVLSGNGQYKVVFDNPLIARTIIDGDEVTFVAMRNGETSAVVEDAKGQKSEPIRIKVDAPAYAMRLGTDYFCHTNFGNIASVENSIKECKQVTFEMNCKMLGYRGLQTFMGLEGKLIIRGKNDDYKETHPIQIAGLGDKIIMETANSFKLNQWMHLAFVVDCSQDEVTEKYKLYINGIQETLVVNKQDQTHSSVDLTSSNDGNRFVIGRATTQSWRAMNGIVSEARVWTVARSQQQIKDNMCTFAEVEPASGLLARWDFTAGIETDYIQDINGGRFQSNLTISNAQNSGYDPITVPANTFVEKGCPN